MKKPRNAGLFHWCEGIILQIGLAGKSVAGFPPARE